MSPGFPARPGRPAETSLLRSHDEKHRSARGPAMATCSTATSRRTRRRSTFREDGGEIVLGDGSIAVAEPLGRDEAYLVRRGTGSRRAKTARVKALERAEQRARELAIEQAALRQVTMLVARESSPERLFAVATEQVARALRRPARQAGPLRAGRLCRSRRLQRGRSRSVSDRIALAAGQPGCDCSRSADRPRRPRGRLCACDRGDCCCRSSRGHALGRREPDCGRETFVGRDGGSHAAARASP